jgi:RNase H-like domain found in reverse transcriptase/Reverse transcriptase (RNA-dependent DNA polymerase)/Integrase zinc binding domain/Integrase core domain
MAEGQPDMTRLMTELIAAMRDLGQNRNNPSSPTHLQPYDESSETFSNFLQRLDVYFGLRKIGDDRNAEKAQVFMNGLSPKIFRVLTSLTAPQLPKDKTFEELTTLLKAHLDPQSSDISEQHKFATRLQHEGESISSFVAELRMLTLNCNFKCDSCQASTTDAHLRTQFVRGIRDNETREQLIRLKEATFAKVVETALAIETAKIESRQIQNQGAETTMATNAVRTGYNSRRSGRSSKVDKTAATSEPPPTRRRGALYQKLRGKCFRCGDAKHKSGDCPHINAVCSKCNKEGHLPAVCLTTQHSQNQQQIDDSDDDTEDEEPEFYINSIDTDLKDVPRRLFVDVKVNGVALRMEMDTGAAVGSMSLRAFRTLFPNIKLQATKAKMIGYFRSSSQAAGKVKVHIEHNGVESDQYLYLFDHDVDSVCGRQWLAALKINTFELKVQQVEMEPPGGNYLKQIFDTYNDLFVATLGTVPEFRVTLPMKTETQPVFMRPRPVPYALLDRVDKEIDRLEADGIIERVEYASWGTPLVPIVKSDESIRLCADYKVTLNQYLHDDKYPIPKIEDLFARMHGGTYFCTLDVHKAYLHLQMDEEGALLQTISTHKGPYKVKRLMFGVKVAPNVFQRFMDQTLQGLDGVACFFDDILVQGTTLQQTYERLCAVLDRLRGKNLHLNKTKCQFFRRSVRYLGHEIDGKGLHPLSSKVDAIVNVPQPKDAGQVHTFIGMVNYYHKFIKDVSAILHPLRQLMKEGAEFVWDEHCEAAFQHVKKELASDRVLVHFDPKLPLILATDASPFGLGVVLSHIMPDKTERPIAFGSRSLSKSEANYSQIDKEATAIFWGLKKYFQYLYGRRFTLLTDHKALTSIFNPRKGLPALSATRMLHYAQFLSGFDYDIKYRSTNDHSNADFFSRFPAPSNKDDTKVDEITCFQIRQVEAFPISKAELQRETQHDPELQSLYTALFDGTATIDDVQKYSLHDGCIMSGVRVVIPATLRHRVLTELHEGHMGVTKMKSLARSYCYWRGIDADIEKLVKSCKPCCLIQKNPGKQQPVHLWDYPKQPWERVHIDYAGPFMERNFFILVDAHTKWPEIVTTRSTDSTASINILRSIFGRFGLPYTLVSDNGPQFKSAEFERFLKQNGIQHKTSAPYHPATNGQAERLVQTMKQSLRAMSNEPGDVQLKLTRFLFQYRVTPHATTHRSPAELMFGRHIRTRLDVMRSSVQQEMVDRYVPPGRVRTFKTGQPVQVRFYGANQKWKFGTISQQLGSLHYAIRIDGAEHIRHIDQIRSTEEEFINDGRYSQLNRDEPARPFPDKSTTVSTPSSLYLSANQPSSSGTSSNERRKSAPSRRSLSFQQPQPQQLEPVTPPAAFNEPPVAASTPQPVRRSERVRRAPQRLNL